MRIAKFCDDKEDYILDGIRRKRKKRREKCRKRKVFTQKHVSRLKAADTE